MYQVLLFKFGRHLCKGSIGVEGAGSLTTALSLLMHRLFSPSVVKDYLLIFCRRSLTFCQLCSSFSCFLLGVIRITSV